MDEADFIYSKNTLKPFEDVVVSAIKGIEKRGWAVFTVYDIQERLATKGFTHGKMKIIEFCSAKNVDRVLGKNPLVSICMPCRISVFEKDGKTTIASMKPAVMGSFFKGVESSDTEDVDAGIREIIHDAV